jgi:hypothetical protein
MKPIQWPSSPVHEPASAFSQGSAQRPLRITFHTSSYAEAPAIEKDSVVGLRELAKLDDIEAIDTEPGDQPHLIIGQFSRRVPHIPVQVNGPNVVTDSGVSDPEQWFGIAERISIDHFWDRSATQMVLKDLLVAQAHRVLGRDILVTLSPWLIEHQSHSLLRAPNQRTPLQALKIVGLFLRSRSGMEVEVYVPEVNSTSF